MSLPREPSAEDLEIVELTRLQPHPANPRVHDDATIQQSMRDHGVVDVVVAQRSSGRILGGHGRYENAGKVGATTVPVLWVDCDDEEAEEILLVLNASSDRASYDLAKLTASIDRIRASGDLERLRRTGWTEDALERARKTLTPRPSARDLNLPDLPVPGPPREPVTQPGDIWTVGPHRVMCGDARDFADVAILMNGAQIQLAFTSPPYAEQREYDESSGFKPIPPDEYVAWFAPVAAHVAQHLAVDGSWFVNIKPMAEGLDTQLYVMDLVLAHARWWGWHFATEFCWQRVGFPGQYGHRFKNQFEPVYQFVRGLWKFRSDAVKVQSPNVPAYVPDTIMSRPLGDSQGVAGNRFAIHEDGMALPGNRLPTFSSTHDVQAGHKAAFPIGLPAWFTRAYTDLGDTVYDPFLGSGSTIMAAHREGRIGYGMEISPAYVDVTLARLQREVGTPPLRAGQPHDFSHLLAEPVPA